MPFVHLFRFKKIRRIICRKTGLAKQNEGKYFEKNLKKNKVIRKFLKF